MTSHEPLPPAHEDGTLPPDRAVYEDATSFVEAHHPHIDEAEPEEAQMSLLSHLTELRRRLLWCVGAYCIAFLGCYNYAEPIYGFLVAPLSEALHGDRRMIYTGLTEAFYTYLKVGAFAAFFVSFPVVALQIWGFVAPGLYKNEKNAFLPFLIATPVLFISGAALLYYGVMPMLIGFFLGFETVGGQGALPIQLEARVSEYLSLMMQLIIAFGVAFELPVLLTLLAKVGLLRSETLVAKRRYAIVIIFIVAAILTPPDGLSQIMLSLPLMGLYELSIYACRRVEPK